MQIIIKINVMPSASNISRIVYQQTPRNKSRQTTSNNNKIKQQHHSRKKRPFFQFLNFQRKQLQKATN